MSVPLDKMTGDMLIDMYVAGVDTEEWDDCAAVREEMFRRDTYIAKLEKENADLRRLYNEAMEQLNFNGGDLS